MYRKLFIGMLVITMLVSFSTNTTFAKDDAEDSIQLNSEAAIIIDAKSGAILYEKNSGKRMYPASITKIVTGIMALEQGNPDDIVTVSKKARNVDGTRVYLLEGEKVPLYKLVQGLLINSGNDAAIAIAEHMEGSVEKFAESMNQFVKEQIGVKDSHFANPHGLFDKNHYTTAYDMAKITQYAMQNEDFRKIVGTKELKWNGAGWDTTLYNHNKLLWWYDGAIGVKNGWVTQSGYTLVTAAKRGDTELIVVALKGTTWDNIYKDTTDLLDYGFANFETKKVPSGETFGKNGNKYLVQTDLYFTEEKGTTPIMDITDAGELVIKSNDQMETKEKLTNLTELEEKKMDKNEDENKNWLGSILDFLIHPFHE